MITEEITSRNFTALTDEYRKFIEEKDACKQCEMYGCYGQNIQSEGCAVNPTFMFIGECGGKEEATENRPFTGKAGQFLRAELKKHSDCFNKQTSIITNVLSCRPLNNKFPKPRSSLYTVWEDNERTSKKLVMDVAQFCAQKWLFREIEMLQPKILIILGSVSLKYVCGKDSIMKCRGEWTFVPRFRAWALPTFHPSYVLRMSHAADQVVLRLFEQDVAKVVETWATTVQNDYRMQMSLEDWKREYAITKTQDQLSL